MPCSSRAAMRSLAGPVNSAHVMLDARRSTRTTGRRCPTTAPRPRNPPRDVRGCRVAKHFGGATRDVGRRRDAARSRRELAVAVAGVIGVTWDRARCDATVLRARARSRERTPERRVLGRERVLAGCGARSGQETSRLQLGDPCLLRHHSALPETRSPPCTSGDHAIYIGRARPVHRAQM